MSETQETQTLTLSQEEYQDTYLTWSEATQILLQFHLIKIEGCNMVDSWVDDDKLWVSAQYAGDVMLVAIQILSQLTQIVRRKLPKYRAKSADYHYLICFVFTVDQTTNPNHVAGQKYYIPDTVDDQDVAENEPPPETITKTNQNKPQGKQVTRKMTDKEQQFNQQCTACGLG